MSESNSSESRFSTADLRSPYRIEKCRVELRRIIPKGASFSKLTAEDVSPILNHINSVSRERLGNKTPFDLFSGKCEKKLPDLLNCHQKFLQTQLNTFPSPVAFGNARNQQVQKPGPPQSLIDSMEVCEGLVSYGPY